MLLARVAPNHTARRKNMPLHGIDQRHPIGVRRIDVQRRVQGEDLEIVRMRLTGRRLWSKVAWVSARVLALHHPVGKRGLSRSLRGKAPHGGRYVVDDPVHDGFRTIYARVGNKYRD